MFSLKEKLFKFFGYYEAVTDSYKNNGGKGLYERLMMTLGEEYDSYTLVAIADLIDNTLVPNKLLLKFLPYAEAQIGAPYIIEDELLRRKLLRFLIPIYKIKGTKVSYEKLFRIFGFDVDFRINTTPTPLLLNNYYILESLSESGTAAINNGFINTNLIVGNKYYVQNNTTNLITLTGDAVLKRETIIDFYKSNYTLDEGNLPGGGFEDINVTFDDVSRKFDSKCNGCSNYVVKLYGPFALTEELHNAIFRIIEFCEPINADLITVYYNDVVIIADDSISIWIDENGDLIYNNVAVPENLVNLTADGNLEINGVIIGTYYLDLNGDLIFSN